MFRVQTYHILCADGDTYAKRADFVPIFWHFVKKGLAIFMKMCYIMFRVFFTMHNAP